MFYRILTSIIRLFLGFVGFAVVDFCYRKSDLHLLRITSVFIFWSLCYNGSSSIYEVSRELAVVYV